MSRLGPQKPAVMKRVFRANGLEVKKTRGKQQGKGSHCAMEHPDDANKSTIVPGYSEIDKSLAARMIRQAGKTIKEYLSHLK